MASPVNIQHAIATTSESVAQSQSQAGLHEPEWQQIIKIPSNYHRDPWEGQALGDQSKLEQYRRVEWVVLTRFATLLPTIGGTEGYFKLPVVYGENLAAHDIARTPDYSWY